ncbi:AAA family ATPase [Fibrobacter sp.]|uniref:AAA family ATPase n=1 Tax=Fibrobacter sp. TaxID=35828 RepID=UPI003890EE69
MNIMIYGNSGSGKTTLATILKKKYGYVHINTGQITRLMADMDCHNLPVIVQTMVSTMDTNKDHCFDHFYIHTYEQLCDLGMTPAVICLVDNRTIDHADTSKRERWLCQDPEIVAYLDKVGATVIKVYNTDYGFDVSELIRAKYLPFNAFAMERP